jgi:serine phosphatase RsbU (regulator of sigma subunit)
VSFDAQDERFELLAAVGEVADGSLSLGETVERLLEIVVPAFADVATLDAVSGRDKVERLGARVRGPRRTELELELLRERRSSNRAAGVARAIATGESELISRWSDELMRSVAAGEDNLDLLRSLELRSVIYLPLRARGQIVGALVCGVGSSGREYGEDDLRFGEVLAGRFALALDNAGLSEAISGLEQQLEATLANLAEAILVRDAHDALVYANPAALALLRVPSLEDLSHRTRDDLMDLYDAFDEHGHVLGLEDLPTTQAKQGVTPEPLLVRNVIRATGEERWLLHKATPVFDAGGAVSLVVNVIEDVTSVKRAELAQRLLAEAGKELSSSLDYEQTLQRLANLVVPEVADWCGVVMRGRGDVLDQVAVAHRDPAKVALAREFGQRYPARLSDPTGAARVIRTGESQLVEEITDELLAEVELAEAQLELVRDLQMRSVIIVPLALAGRPPIGAMTLVMAESARRFDDDDLVLAEELGRRAATAVENGRLYTERAHVATTLQQSLLPPELPEIPGFRLASLYRAAGGQSEVGGDFYDAFEVPGGWMALVGDVAGRGTEAATLTSLSRYTFRTAAKLMGDPVGALRQLNHALCERPRLSLVTVCCALLRELDGAAQADVVLAGHPPAYHVHAGVARPIGFSAPFLGVYEDGWRPETVTLEPGDLLVFYTDGVIDTAGETERFGEARLAGALEGARDARDAVAQIELAVSAFADGPQVDDTAVLAIERL